MKYDRPTERWSTAVFVLVPIIALAWIGFLVWAIRALVLWVTAQ